MKLLLLILVGYLLGSLLPARFFVRLLAKEDIVAKSPDGNPGTYNAFQCGGFWCGCVTLFSDLLKGFLPVAWYQERAAEFPVFGIAFVLAAPVCGHAFSVFHRFHGGKGIAVSFGCLLGLFPDLRPAVILAVVFIFLSLVVKISPHYYRTLFTYLVSVCIMPCFVSELPVLTGFLLITVIVMVRLILSKEEKGKCEVKIGWKS